MEKLYQTCDTTTCVLLAIALILLSGFLMTRLTKQLRLPNVTGYILAGILIGPCVGKLVPEELVIHMDFISDIALACIAFGVGQFFKRESLQRSKGSVIVITIFEAVIAGILVCLAMHYLAGQEWGISIILGAIATATAPASTMMTIKQYGADGNFVSTLLQVVALDDAVCLLVFSFAVAFATMLFTGQISITYVVMPLVWNVIACIAGVCFGCLLSKLITPKRTNENRLILTFSLLLALAGLCSIVDCSPLLACMIMSAVYINRTGDDCLYKILDRFTPPIMSMFFVISGMNLNVGMLKTVGVVGVIYFITRIVGKMAGAAIGCQLTGATKNIRNNLGLTLIPQAGVAIGLAVLSRRIIPGEEANLVMTIILSSSVLYELIGPACAKIGLIRGGAIPQEAGVRFFRNSRLVKRCVGIFHQRLFKKEKVSQESF